MDIALTLKYAGRHVFKRNPQVLRWWRDLVSRERAPPDVHRRQQETALADIFRAATRIPAYATAARRAPARNLLTFLRTEFPVIDKVDLLKGGPAYLPGGHVAWRRFTTAATSGTTGTPLDVFRSIRSMWWEEAFHLQHWGWAGWRPGQRQAVLRGDIVIPTTREQPPFWFVDAVGGQLFLSTRHLDERTAELYALQLGHFAPTQLRAYPSAAHDLAEFFERRGIEIRLNAVITGSEMLYEFQRRRIERVFQARVFDFYGLAERVAYASECEHGSMHVNPEYGVVEIVDARGQPTTGVGTVVGTSLHNHMMPLIRYRTNDTARWSPAPCACGRTYPVIERISGRLADQLYDLDGRAVNCTVIGFAFDGMHNIKKAQVVQETRDAWRIRIVPGAGYTAEDGQQVLRKLAEEVSARVNASIELVADIPPLPNGKYQWVVQKCARGRLGTGLVTLQ